MPEPPRNAFQYAIVRLLPRVERGECLNVGVILLCRERRYLGARMALDEGRLAAFAPGLDPATVRPHLEAIERIAAGDPTAGPIAHLGQAERFHWLVSPSSTIIQPSEVHSGLVRRPRSRARPPGRHARRAGLGRTLAAIRVSASAQRILERPDARRGRDLDLQVDAIGPAGPARRVKARSRRSASVRAARPPVSGSSRRNLSVAIRTARSVSRASARMTLASDRAMRSTRLLVSGVRAARSGGWRRDGRSARDERPRGWSAAVQSWRVSSSSGRRGRSIGVGSAPWRGRAVEEGLDVLGCAIVRSDDGRAGRTCFARRGRVWVGRAAGLAGAAGLRGRWVLARTRSLSDPGRVRPPDRPG